jgi:ParB-like chromosome segregation protein Spo0J
MSERTFHPLANIFPLLEGAEFDTLVADIKANGLLEPVVVYDDQILDGRNRYRACVTAGVEPVFVPYQGDDPLTFVISKNLKRRHLDESQRAMVAARLATLPKGANQHASIEAPSQNNAADLLNVSRSGVQRARKVKENGTPELVAAVDRGEVSVSAAAEVATQPAEVQQEIVAGGNVKKAAKEIRVSYKKEPKKYKDAIVTVETQSKSAEESAEERKAFYTVELSPRTKKNMAEATAKLLSDVLPEDSATQSLQQFIERVETILRDARKIESFDDIQVSDSAKKRARTALNKITHALDRGRSELRKIAELAEKNAAAKR